MLLVIAAVYLSVISCSAVQTSADPESTAIPDLGPQILAADKALPEIEPPAVVYVGEVHTRYADHINQLAVISVLRERGLNVAIGMEMIQTPFQQLLNDYVEGRTDFEGMLEQTEYFSRWRYDPRLYEPIFEYARQHGIQLVALNAPRELTDRVSEVGIAGLDDSERRALPEKLTPLAPSYRTLLEEVYQEHAASSGGDLDRFLDVQQTWDEVMGKQSVDFIRTHRDHVLVVLAGAQHVVNGHGIPAKVESALGRQGTIVLSAEDRERFADGGDVFLEPVDASLPDSGRMGAYIDTTESGAVIAGFTEDSPAQDAGAKENDVIVKLNQRSIDDFGDIKLALWKLLPGDPVLLEVRRGAEGAVETLSFELY